MFLNRFYNFLNVIRGPSRHSVIIVPTRVYRRLNMVCENPKHLHAVHNKALVRLRKMLLLVSFPEEFCKMGFWKTLQKSQKNNYDEVSF